MKTSFCTHITTADGCIVTHKIPCHAESTFRARTHWAFIQLSLYTLYWFCILVCMWCKVETSVRCQWGARGGWGVFCFCFAPKYEVGRIDLCWSMHFVHGLSLRGHFYFYNISLWTNFWCLGRGNQTNTELANYFTFGAVCLASVSSFFAYIDTSGLIWSRTVVIGLWNLGGLQCPHRGAVKA